jgi:prepilin-type processing-associated H-X9-DG protein
MVLKRELRFVAFAGLLFPAAVGVAATAVVQERSPSFAPSDSFQTAPVWMGHRTHHTGGMNLTMADGSVRFLRQGLYTFKVQGIDKAGEVMIIIICKQGKKVGQLIGKVKGLQSKALGGPDTKSLGGPDTAERATGDVKRLRFSEAGFASKLVPKLTPQGGGTLLVLEGKSGPYGKGSIEVLLPAVR